MYTNPINTLFNKVYKSRVKMNQWFFRENHIVVVFHSLTFAESNLQREYHFVNSWLV